MTRMLGAPRKAVEQFLETHGYPRYRAKQIETWIYRHGAHSYRECTNLPASLIATLTDAFPLGATPHRTVQISSDETRKYLFPVGGNQQSRGDEPGSTGHRQQTIEAALIPEGKRLTLCLSTQVGCRRACTFCQTGRQGFHGNLETADILNQYHSLPERSNVTNIVYMGMGEPLDNPEAVLESLDTLTDPHRYALSPRRITLSTVGIHPALEEFLRRSPVNLAISIHNPFPEERRLIMPVERDHPIEKTLDLIRSTREDRKRRITFEYTLFDGVNDTQRHARELARVLGGLSTRVNLIAFHQFDTTRLKPTPRKSIERFAEWLRERGVRTFIRASRGQDIEAACGMLWTDRNRSD